MERDTFEALLVLGCDRLVVLEEETTFAAGIADRVILTGLRFVNLELSTEFCLECRRWNPWGRVGDSGLSCESSLPFLQLTAGPKKKSYGCERLAKP